MYIQQEDEISIWEENQLNTNGVNSNQFIDSRGQQLDFYQIYSLHFALYQQAYLFRINTNQEVQILSLHFNKEIPREYLQYQHCFLDKYYDTQKKNQSIQQKIQRSKSSYEKNQFSSTKLNQQIIKRHQIRIDQKQITKLMQIKIVPVRQIDLTNDNNNYDDHNYEYTNKSKTLKILLLNINKINSKGINILKHIKASNTIFIKDANRVDDNRGFTDGAEGRDYQLIES
ncbi:hypothetical protein TTHERM_00643440 (macronuclear) [Tetrahymena thermophila SB210]|uniref:Uncharacterized protein n=1 Tax=Tetrahymena thermophila (strain SB210) TaxID=312017 RepID=Q23EY7_TETTS|nr:hypothetical protein TTHERM_00643440 [Tetrahymena thermophila SB210]EAR95118.1 hypothetical protein TTHERM_00643440 [Tetrahymena thermophila SB210]|eukprot:XP_001015363.1 hypothetical protein TTHERM_00643440 [Tetrahymena thermophila SB210]